MAPVRPIPDSILKRTKDRSVPVRPSGLPHVSKTEHLLRTLKEARFFKEILENVLEDLMNFEWKSPKSGSLCVASALKMLSGTQGLYMKCFYEQRLLMERLRTKLESRGTAGGILSFLAEEAHGKESALSNELQNDSNLQVCCLNNQKGNREGWPESRLAPVMSDGIPTDRKDHDKMMQELTLFIRNEHKTATSEIHGQVKAMNILVASMKEDFERDQKVYLASKRTLSAQQKNLSLALNKTRAEAELRLEKQLKRAQDIIQDFSVKSSELLSAKADLRSLEAEVRDLKWSIEDSGFSRAVPDECDSKYVLDQIGSLSKFLKDARVPEHQFRQVCSEIDALCYSVALASTPDVSKRYDNESIQTVLTGARFAEAIKAHAEKLFKNSKSKKRKDVNVIAAGESSTPRKSGSK